MWHGVSCGACWGKPDEKNKVKSKFELSPKKCKVGVISVSFSRKTGVINSDEH